MCPVRVCVCERERECVCVRIYINILWPASGLHDVSWSDRSLSQYFFSEFFRVFF